MMYENQSGEDFDELRELIQQYEELKAGRAHSFLDEDSFEQIIDYFDDQDKLFQAIQAAEYGIEQFPYSASLLLKKANLLIETKHYHEALDLLGKAEVLDATDINLYILKTDIYLAMNQHEKAVRLLEQQITEFEGEDRTDLLLELADVYDDWEEFDKVFDCLKMVLEYDGRNEEALHKICFWTEFTGRSEESITLHNNIINEYPYNELAWFNLGTAYQGLKLYEKAVDAYQYAVAINEKFDYAYRNMADAFIRLRKYNEAIEVLQRHLEVAKPEDVIYEAIGHCYEKQKKYDQSRYYFRKAYHLSPGDDRLYYRVAHTYMLEKNWQQAVKNLSTAIRLNSNSVEYLLSLGECYLQLKQHHEALQYLLDAIGLRPSSVRARLSFIRGLFAAGLYKDALMQIDIAEEDTAKKPVYRYYRCAVLLATGKTREALLQLESALAEAPRQVKKLSELDPSVLQHTGVADLIARYKRRK